METIDKELEKLLCYTLKKEVIEAGDVRAVVTERPENKVFEMVDAIAGHDRKKALDLYSGLLALKEPPMRILYLLMRQFRILLAVKELSKKGYSSFDIAKKAGIPEFAVRKHQAQAGGFSEETALFMLQEGALLEEDVKTGKMQDKIAVEILIIKYGKNK